MAEPMSDERLAEIRKDHAAYEASHAYAGSFACCSAHSSADDVPELLAEVERLRGELARRPLDIIDTLYPAAEEFTAAEARRHAAYETEQAAAPRCVCGCPLGQRCTCDDSADHGDPREADGKAN